jgi:hypothetical protein
VLVPCASKSTLLGVGSVNCSFNNFLAPESDFEDSLDLPTTSYLQLGASGGEDER